MPFALLPTDNTKKRPANQIPVSDEKIAEYFSPDDPWTFIHTNESENDATLDSDFDEEGGTDRLRKLIINLSGRMGVSPPPDVLVMDSGDYEMGSIKVGNRNLIITDRRLIRDLPGDKQWDYLEAILAHELGHLQESRNVQLLEMIHPDNKAYHEVEFGFKVARIKVSEGQELSKERLKTERDLFNNRLELDQSHFEEELAQTKASGIPPQNQLGRIQMELRADRSASEATKRPGVLKDALIWLENKYGVDGDVFLALANAGGLDHPLNPTRFAHLDFLAKKLGKEKCEIPVVDVDLPNEIPPPAPTPAVSKAPNLTLQRP